MKTLNTIREVQRLLLQPEPTLSTSHVQSGALFSHCRKYRYVLWRRWEDGPECNFIMLNPSTADESKNDPTVERCERRARAWGYSGLVVTNLFAFRSTSPEALKSRWNKHPVSEQDNPEANNAAIIGNAMRAGIVICGWGNHGRYLKRSDEVVLMLQRSDLGDKLHALKVGKNGEPTHPLYLAYKLEPELLGTLRAKREIDG